MIDPEVKRYIDQELMKLIREIKKYIDQKIAEAKK